MIRSLVVIAACLAASPQDAAAPKARVAELKRKAESFLNLLVKGGIIMIPIGLCSVVALAVGLERAFALRRRRVLPPQFLKGLRDALHRGPEPYQAGVEFCDSRPSPMSEIAKAGLLKLPQEPAAVKPAMEEAGARAVSKMKRSLRPLAAIAQLAPLLGLLGTVYGMISAFQVASAAGVGRGDQLANGIYEALVTTAAGLTVAIPVLIVHQVLTGRIDAHVDALDECGEEMLEEVRRRGAALRS